MEQAFYDKENPVKKVIVTGGAGFIGSAFVWKLNNEGVDDILIVDNLGHGEKWKNLVGLRYSDYLHRDAFIRAVADGSLRFEADGVVHMGACSSTTERDAEFLMANNTRFTRTLAEWSVARNARFLYASSAATYGDGGAGFSDGAELDRLRPLNMYGYSKHLFDLYARRTGISDKITGLKFFNVFGPNEYHKGDMTSVVFKAYHQILEVGKVKLFQSYRKEYGDGDQMRDFVYIKDCVEAMWRLLIRPDAVGLFNLGTGKARSWNDLVRAIFAAMGRKADIEYIPMPEALQGKYQYFTEADMTKAATTGYFPPFGSLEDSVRDYVVNHLAQDYPWLSPDGGC